MEIEFNKSDLEYIKLINTEKYWYIKYNNKNVTKIWEMKKNWKLQLQSILK